MENTVSLQELAVVQALASGAPVPIKPDFTGGIGVFGHAPPPTQPVAIADPTGAVTDQDDEARTAINAILVVLRDAGLIAT